MLGTVRVCVALCEREIKFACLPNLEKLGFSEDMYVPF